MKKKIINYVKDNKFYLLIMFICFCFLILQMSNVVMYADDFVLKVVSMKGINNIINNQINHYFTWGGGFTPILVTTFLLFNSIVWKIFISSLILIIFFLVIKLLNIKDQFEKCLIALLLWSCLFLINIEILNQTLYWLDGSFAYTFVIFQTFIYLYYIITRVFKNISHKYDMVLFPIISFFGGWSSAQTGAVVLILPIFIIIYQLIKKVKISKLSYISMILGMIGFGIFYFAPGNSARMSNMGIFSELGIFEKVVYKVDGVYSHLLNFKDMFLTSTPIFILITAILLIVLGYYFVNKDNKKNIFVKTSLIYMFITVIAYLGISLNIHGNDILLKHMITFSNIYENFSSEGLLIFVPYIVSTLFIISTVIVAHYIYIKTDDPTSMIFIISGYISQFVMVMSPQIEYRTTFIIILFLIVSIASLISLCYKEKISNYLLLIIPFLMFEFSYGVIALILLLLANTLNSKILYKVSFLIIILLIAYLSFVSYKVTYDNYSSNEVIYNQNIEALKEYKAGDKKIYIKEYPYPEYAFTNIVGTDWIEKSVKQIYKIDDSVNFVIIQ